MHGSTVWEYRARHPEETRAFDRAMAAGTERYAEAVLDTCDFSRFDHVVDVGGGDGIFLAKILARHPRVRGTLFDQPHVVGGAAAARLSGECAGRWQAIGGDFLAGVPGGGDAYLLKWVLHNWSDTAAVEILRSCRQAMRPGGRVLIVEHVIGPPNASPDGKFMDVTMMVMNGGRDRTRAEFASLLVAAGFRLVAVTPTSTPLSVIEGAIDDG